MAPSPIASFGAFMPHDLCPKLPTDPVIPPKISGVQKPNFLGKISEEIYDEEWTI